MKIHRVVAPTMAEALKQIRELMGADAVILSNKKVDEGIEIVAAMDYDEEQMYEEFQQQGDATLSALTPGEVGRVRAEKHLMLEREMQASRERIARSRHQQAEDTNPPASRLSSCSQDGDPLERAGTSPAKKVRTERRANVVAGGSQPVSKNNAAETSTAIAQMKAQLDEMQHLLTAQLKENARLKSSSFKNLQKRLQMMGFSEDLQGKLLEPVLDMQDSGQAWRRVMVDIAKRINIGKNLIDQRGVISFLGATGAGKTTTIGKLAAQFVLKYSPEELALVTTDSYRIASHEQLRVFGSILKVPVHVTGPGRDLNTILSQLRDKRLILVDTAGLNPASDEWKRQLTEFAGCHYPIAHHLVVPATSQSQVISSTYEAHHGLGLNGCIITKADEAPNLGQALEVVIKQRIAVAHIADGQRIPDDLHPASAAALVSKAVGLLKKSHRKRKHAARKACQNNGVMLHASKAALS